MASKKPMRVLLDELGNPTGLAEFQVGETIDPAYLPAVSGGWEPIIVAGTAADYWRGDKTWHNFGADVRATAATGLVTTDSGNASATDTIIVVLGKYQAQLSLKVDKVAGMGLSSNDFTSTLLTKLNGIATGATANATDATLRDRTTHTGAQLISTVTNLQATLDTKQGNRVAIINSSTAYTVVTADLGKIINCTGGTFTVSLTAVTTLGAGFNCWVWNASTVATDVLTVTPDATELLDGQTNLTLRCGEGVELICDGVGWQTGGKKVMRGYTENFAPTTARPLASAQLAIAIGAGATASNTAANAIGFSVAAASAYSTAIGNNSTGGGSQAVTGAGAMALGGSYASGANSLAAAIGDNTSSYGAIGPNSVAIGSLAKSSGTSSIAIGATTIASSSNAIAIGNTATASNSNCVAIGYQTLASGVYSWASGAYSVSAQYGKHSQASGRFTTAGDAQAGKMVLRRASTDATPVALTSNGQAPGGINQIILADYSATAFKITVIAQQKAAEAPNVMAAYEFIGCVNLYQGTVTLGNLVKTVLFESDPTWDCTVIADQTNGGISIVATGAAAKSIRWVATVNTTEVTYN